MIIYYYTNKGKRSNNEDSLLIKDIVINNNMKKYEKLVFNDNKGKFFISDGLGGEEAGEIASQTILNELINSSNLDSIDNIHNEINNIKSILDDYSIKHNNLVFGATLGGISLGEKSFIINIGDTRVYKISNVDTKQLSIDHTLIMKYVENGHVPKSNIRFNPMRNLIVSSISGGFENSITKTNIKKLNYTKNDIFLICSDGVWELFDDEEIYNVFLNYSLENGLDLFFQKLINNCKDNISFIIIKIEE
ncbi:protein phosphatase [Hypnocyclicus thermotrophus]|uniref:Protein phosphatase n=1 Tax=Hypnocyclicus thermotrophus TaxID=1627895 RepID=A0AA46E0H7_9FUSO|nr:PP2C family serine/threonine-protein phosphatase [Hypnocyclicus thermotrophus]TDT72604.1 protein phosphatase [Hypnocyclicus thermotrophus]